jgi:diacylglycerol kinase family enzyme
VHEVIQGLVSETGESTATLGIIPMGSANALARHLRISLHPLKAALQQIDYAPQTVPIGKITFGGQVRYFAVMAGAGPDGVLVYSLMAGYKSRLGRFAYYFHAARLFASRRFAPFAVEYTDATSGSIVSQPAVSAMAVRVGNLGGLFSGLVGRPANIHDPRLQLILLGPPAWLSLPLWFITGWLNLHSLNGFLHTAKVSRFSCRPLSNESAHFEADGEWLGRIPFAVSLIPDALRILVPGVDRDLQPGAITSR